MSCRDAIRQTWPKDLWEQAFVVLDHENGTEDPKRIGHNSDLAHSTDNGCLQINDYWHFGHGGWTNFNDIYNPTFNAALAYKIYQGRGWQSWYGAKGIYW